MHTSSLFFLRAAGCCNSSEFNRPFFTLAPLVLLTLQSSHQLRCDSSVLLKCFDSDIGGTLQGSGWISIMTSCVSLFPPSLCSHFLPPHSSSIYVPVLSVPPHSSPWALFTPSCSLITSPKDLPCLLFFLYGKVLRDKGNSALKITWNILLNWIFKKGSIQLIQPKAEIENIVIGQTIWKQSSKIIAANL